MENNTAPTLKDALISKGIKPHFPVGFGLSEGKPSLPAEYNLVKLPYYKAFLDHSLPYHKPITKI